jgi:hypothetical protein
MCRALRAPKVIPIEFTNAGADAAASIAAAPSNSEDPVLHGNVDLRLDVNLTRAYSQWEYYRLFAFICTGVA